MFEISSSLDNVYVWLYVNLVNANKNLILPYSSQTKYHFKYLLYYAV